MIVTLTLKVSPGEFFAVCPTASHIYFVHERLNYGEKKFFLSLVHKNEVEKKTHKGKLMKFPIIEISFLFNLKMIIWSKKIAI